MKELSLPEQLVLLVTSPTKGNIASSRKGATPYGIAGGALLNLLLQRRIRIDEEQVCHVIDAASTGQALHDEIIERMQAESSMSALHWINDIERKQSQLNRRIHAQLVEAGYAEQKEKRMLGLLPLKRFPLTSSGSEAAERLRQSIGDAVRQPQSMSDELFALFSIIHGCRVEYLAFASQDVGTAKQTLKRVFKPEENMVPVSPETLFAGVVTAGAVRKLIVEASNAGT